MHHLKYSKKLHFEPEAFLAQMQGLEAWLVEF